MTDDALTAAVAEVLAAHQYVPSGLRGVSRCACGAPFHGMPHYHRAHAAEQVAQVVREHTAAQQAEVLREAAEALPDETEGPLRVGTALWPESDRDAYSLAVEEAQTALRDRAERLHPEPAPDGGER